MIGTAIAQVVVSGLAGNAGIVRRRHGAPGARKAADPNTHIATLPMSSRC